MLLYLIRHAEAADLIPDHARPLTEHGRDQVRALGKFLRNPKAFAAEEIWHSPLLRARQTAELLVREINFKGPCREVRGLTPEDDPQEIAHTLLATERSIAVVGHEPHLSALGSLLVTGNSVRPVCVMKKGAALALECVGNQALVRWHVAPGLLT
jgi:phosphohistidine phosphatase